MMSASSHLSLGILYVQMNPDTAIHNSKEFCQSHLLGFELQVWEHRHLISTNPPEARRSKVFPWEA